MTQPPAPRPVSRTGIWIGVSLMAGAVLVVVAAGIIFWRGFAGDAVVIDADGEPHTVSLPADDDYGVFLTERRPATCTATRSDGAPVNLGSVSGSYEVNQWYADRAFDTGDGELTFMCLPEAGATDAEVRLGPLPSVATLVGAIFGGLCLAGLLGVSGLALVVVTLVRRNRAAR